MTQQEAAAIIPLLEPFSEDLQRFSDELAKRHPDRFIKRFVFPRNVREVREVFIMEIDGKDEITASAMADATMSDQERKSERLARDAERRETVRVAIVGVGEKRGGKTAPLGAPIDYRHANTNGVPFMDINAWTLKAWGSLFAFHSEVNGVPMDELNEGIAGARTVGAFASPMTSETPMQVSPVR